MRRVRLSIDEARRAALASQGFDKSRPPAMPDKRHIRTVINRLGLLQLDFVNVLVPAHYLVVYSRIGPYQRSRLNDLVYRGRDFIEHWAHEASIVPTSSWPLLEYRRQDYRPWPNSPILKLKGKTKYLQTALEVVREGGPITANDLPPVAGPRRKPGDWHRSLPRWALEVHFGKGAVTVADRLANFQRVYDLPENVVDEPHFSRRLSRDDSQRELLAMAAKALGVATLRDLADYYRMSPRDAAPRVAELQASGVLHEVAVQGWRDTAYLHRDTCIPRRLRARALLSPFDPVVWFRPRGERLFNFHYRIEIYVPEAKRKWGYYVLPFLLDDRIVARVDLKADRKSGELKVLASHLEEDAEAGRVCEPLADELGTLAAWLGLERVTVARKGTLARELARQCRALKVR